MSQPFSNICILGSGLLGGSLAMALGRQPSALHVRLWARRAATVAEAQSAGIGGATGDLAVAVAGADLAILCVPVGAMPALVRDAVAAGLPEGCLLTDVGSVKQAPHASLRPLLAGRQLPFIGSHPMAGSEQGGIQAADPNLFHGAACLLTNDEQAPQDAANALEHFWQTVGCRTSWTTASAHDALVARISHLPHIVAAAAAHVCLATPGDGAFGGGGLRDTTRVAGGNPDMWTEILNENREAIAAPLRETIHQLEAILAALDAADQDAARQWLATAKDRRDLLNPPT